jgi:hypothetical protein
MRSVSVKTVSGTDRTVDEVGVVVMASPPEPVGLGASGPSPTPMRLSRLSRRVSKGLKQVVHAN